MNLPKAKKIDIQKYEGGLSKLANITDAIKLSANESALGCSPNAKKAFYDCQSFIAKYPDSGSQILKNNGKNFPPNYLHESWRDFLYWDTELENNN